MEVVLHGIAIGFEALECFFSLISILFISRLESNSSNVKKWYININKLTLNIKQFPFNLRKHQRCRKKMVDMHIIDPTHGNL